MRDSKAPPDGGGHHTGEGRDVVHASLVSGGHDVFFSAVRVSRMPMCLSDPNQPDNPLVFVNRAFEDLTGYTEEEMLGRNCRFLQGADTDPAVVAEIRRSIAARVDISVEIYNHRKNGAGFWNALYLSPVFGEADKLLYFFASQFDVTKRREAEAMSRQGQRMDVLGAMAAGIAHEFRNLMTIVQGSLEQASAHPSNERQARQLARAEWGAVHAGRLTQQILSFSRRQPQDTRLTDLSELARNMDSLLKHVAGGRITLRLEAAPEPLPVLVDSSQLELALLNLVRNATDAMPEGGTLTISARRMDRAADDKTEGPVGGKVDGRRFAVLEVADTGDGMSPEIARRVIEPFFTTKGRGQGIGQRLNMARDFASQCGGALEIDSAVGQGTRIRIVLPRWTETSGHMA